MAIVSFDIDDTITSHPILFSQLGEKLYLNNSKVVIISSRLNTPKIRKETEEELKGYGIRYDDLYLFESMDDMAECPYEELDWEQQYLYQKIHYAKQAHVSMHYDDDDRVLELFKKYAPEIGTVDAKELGD